MTAQPNDTSIPHLSRLREQINKSTFFRPLGRILFSDKVHRQMEQFHTETTEKKTQIPTE